MRPINFLVLLVIGLKQAFATGTKYHRLTRIIWVTAFSVGYDRLFFAEDSWAVADVSFEYFGFHLVHPFWRLDKPLVEQAVKLCAFLPDLLPVSQISFAELIHEFRQFISSFNDLQCSLVILNSFRVLSIICRVCVDVILKTI